MISLSPLDSNRPNQDIADKKINFTQVILVLAAIAIPIITTTLGCSCTFSFKMSKIKTKLALTLKILIPITLGFSVALMEILLYVCIFRKKLSKKGNENFIETLEKPSIELTEETYPKTEPTTSEVQKYITILRQCNTQFASIMPPELVCSIPETPRKDLNCNFVLDNKITWSLLKNHSAVHQLTSIRHDNRFLRAVFLLIKISIFDKQDNYINTIIEIIEEYYIAEPNCASADGFKCKSLLFENLYQYDLFNPSFKLNENDLIALKSILEGKSVTVIRKRERLGDLAKTVTFDDDGDEITLILRMEQDWFLNLDERLQFIQEIKAFNLMIQIDHINLIAFSFLFDI